jgi:uncharacterized repeat protein (TIGR03803 family)
MDNAVVRAFENLPRLASFACIAVVCSVVAPMAGVCRGQTFDVLANFNGTNGAYPRFVTLVQGRDGNLWGTSAALGSTKSSSEGGTIYKVTPAGELTVEYNLNINVGSAPAVGLTLSPNGDFYGVAGLGGYSNNGSVFKMDSTGTLTDLLLFDGKDGSDAEGALTQGTDGNFYGTTNFGGSSQLGTVFKITPAGTLTTLLSFDSTTGANPYGQLVQGTDGNFYGITELGGDLTCSNGGCGTVYKITPTGGFTKLARDAGSVAALSRDFVGYGTRGSGAETR